MASYATMLEGAYTAFADECRQEMARLRALREERNARTREALTTLRHALAEGKPFLRAQGFLLVDEPDPEAAEVSPRAAPGLSIADAASRQVVVHILVEEATFSVTQPISRAAEPYVTTELEEVVTRVGQILARHRCVETGDVPAPAI